MQFEETKVRYLPQIEDVLSHLFSDSRLNGVTANADMTSYQFETGGKRLRALIPSMIYEAFGRTPENCTPAVMLGAAVEMVHNATLVHDDLQDGDELRRGQATVWKKFSSAQAINCGDAMFQYAFQILGRAGFEPDVLSRLIERFSGSTLKVIEGQAQEFLMKDEVYPNVARYLEVIRGKTSGLFSLPIVAALESLNVDARSCEKVAAVATDLGMLFQIQDDILDIYGDKGREKKATDIAEGKTSVFVAHVNEEGSAEDKKALADILRKPRLNTTDQDILTAIAIFEKYDAKTRAIALIREFQGKIEFHSEPALEPSLDKVSKVLNSLSELFLEPLHGIL